MSRLQVLQNIEIVVTTNFASTRTLNMIMILSILYLSLILCPNLISSYVIIRHIRYDNMQEDDIGSHDDQQRNLPPVVPMKFTLEHEPKLLKTFFQSLYPSVEFIAHSIEFTTRFILRGASAFLFSVCSGVQSSWKMMSGIAP